MKRTRSGELTVVGVVVLSSVWFLSSAAQEGRGGEKSLAERVTVLEGLVAQLITSVNDLTERVEALEQGQTPPATSFDVLHLNPLSVLPGSPAEGDLCVAWGERVPGATGNILYCYLDGAWVLAAATPVPNPDIRE